MKIYASGNALSVKSPFTKIEAKLERVVGIVELESKNEYGLFGTKAVLSIKSELFILDFPCEVILKTFDDVLIAKSKRSFLPWIPSVSSAGDYDLFVYRADMLEGTLFKSKESFLDSFYTLACNSNTDISASEAHSENLINCYVSVLILLLKTFPLNKMQLHYVSSNCFSSIYQNFAINSNSDLISFLNHTKDRLNVSSIRLGFRNILYTLERMKELYEIDFISRIYDQSKFLFEYYVN